MSLYAEALSKSYNIQNVEKHLILLGGESLKNHHLVNDMKTEDKRYESACLVLYKGVE